MSKPKAGEANLNRVKSCRPAVLVFLVFIQVSAASANMLDLDGLVERTSAEDGVTTQQREAESAMNSNVMTLYKKVFQSGPYNRRLPAAAFEELIQGWNQVSQKYPNSIEASYGLAKALEDKGDSYFFGKKYKSAEKEYEKCLKFCQKTQELKKTWQIAYVRAMVLINIAWIQSDTASDRELSLQTLQQAVRFADEGLLINQHQWLYKAKGFALVDMGETQLKMKQPDRAAESFRGAIANLQTALEQTKIYRTTDKTKALCHQSIALAYEKMSEINRTDLNIATADLNHSIIEADSALALIPDYKPARQIKTTATLALEKLH